MSWLKEKLFLIIGLTLFFGALGAIVFFGVRDFRKLRAAEAEKTELQNKLKALIGSKTAPTRGNVETAQGNLNVFSKGKEDLFTNFPHTNAEPITIGKFLSYFQTEFLNPLRSRARAKQIGVPENFSFAFTTYSAGKIPMAPDIAPLIVQMKVMRQMMEYLMDCRILEIKSVARTPVEASLRNLGGPAGPVTGAGAASGDFVGRTAKTTSVYDGMAFDLVFICETSALQRFLNVLAESYNDKDKRVFLVRSVKTETQSFSPSVQPGTTGGQPSAVSGTRPTTASTVSERVIVDDKLKIQVTMQLDWIQIGGKTIPVPGAPHSNPVPTATSAPAGSPPPAAPLATGATTSPEKH